MPKVTSKKTDRDGEGKMVTLLPENRFNELNGTSLSGYINAPYSALVSLLGEPNCDNDGHKVDAEWAIEMNGKAMTVYNYKDGKNYNGENGLDVEDIRDWHIGSGGDVGSEIEILQKLLNPNGKCRVTC
jgi:hypothetical protein